MKDINFLIVGVGGQGTVLAGDIMAEVGMLAGYDSKKSDVLGLAIRGGSVVSHIRWSEKVDAPMAMRGRVDYLLAFEPLEALRQIEFIHSGSIVIYNEYVIPPVTVSSGLTEYPEKRILRDALEKSADQVLSFNATNKAVEVGSVKTVNVMLIGALSSVLDVEVKVWKKAVEKFVPGKFLEANMRAFSTGRELMSSLRQESKT